MAGTSINQQDTPNWEWNQSSYGYDGVRIEGQDLIWFRQEHNTMAGSAARVQSVADFRSNGAPLPIPNDILAELIAEVAKLADK